MIVKACLTIEMSPSEPVAGAINPRKFSSQVFHSGGARLSFELGLEAAPAPLPRAVPKAMALLRAQKAVKTTRGFGRIRPNFIPRELLRLGHANEQEIAPGVVLTLLFSTRTYLFP